MRCLLLAVVAALAVFTVQIRAQDAGLDEEVISLTDEQMATMLADLFDDEEFAVALEEQTSKREARARGEDPEPSAVEEKSASVDPKDQVRYNNFIDTFLRRLNSHSRTRFDPLRVGLSKKGRKAGPSKDKKGKDNKKNAGKKGKGDKKKSKKGKKGKKSSRHPKDLDLENDQEEEETVPVEEEVEEVHEISKRDADIEVFEIAEEEEEEELDEEDDDVEEGSLVRVTRDAEVEVAPEEDVGRRGKPAPEAKRASPKGKKAGKKGKKGAGKKKKGGKKPKKGGKKGKKGGKKSGKKSKRSAKKTGNKSRTSRATVSGIATLQRSGDVIVVNKGGGKEMRAKFTMGPVDLRMSRKFGSGKSGIQKEARAVSPELTGKLAIHVAQNGRAKMTNFHIARPAIVQVEGTLHKTDKGKSDNNLIENSLNRVTPIASKKLKIAGREILSAGEAKSSAPEE